MYNQLRFVYAAIPLGLFRDIFRSGLSYMTTKYPLLDTLLDCSMSDEDADYVINTTAAFAALQSGS